MCEQKKKFLQLHKHLHCVFMIVNAEHIYSHISDAAAAGLLPPNNMLLCITRYWYVGAKYIYPYLKTVRG